MKIAFLNGSLEPGRDGVGDYTRCLAQECARQGNSCCLIALNDRWLTTPERSDENEIVTLRLPAALNWTERIRLAGETLKAFQPDWISLQFVSYAFQPKGIPLGLAAKLRPLTKQAKFHLMFHELWIGDHAEAKVKERITGEIQKRVILRLIHCLQPNAVHTSNAAYVARLEHQRIHARELPLFGSIPIAEAKGDAWIFPELEKAGLDISPAHRSDFWLFGLFGALHPVWPPEPLFSQIAQAAARQQRKVALLSIGRQGPGEALWKRMAADYGKQFTFLNLGEQSKERISHYLQSLDFGLAASPYSLIGKSSAAAAMLEHGLPVIVNRNDAPLLPSCGAARREEALIIKLDSDFQENMARGRPNVPRCSRLPDVARRLLDDLPGQQTDFVQK